jgi:tRNA A-37 threonylcarbamoyl transferase component Bud32
MAPPANPSPEDLSGRSLGDFEIIRKIGQGGMGQVYLAEQASLKRKVALKFLRPDLAANPVALNRFRAEAEAVARINHANIVQVYTVGAFEDRQFMALEYVEGVNLRDYLVRKGPPDVPRALLILKQVAAALQRAGETGIVHRDIKPENILLTRKGEVKVTDFGLSRVFGADELHLTRSGMTMGTPLYMSPEQVQGKQVDPRSDIYSFGVTAYHLLCGKPPFTGENAVEVAMKHVHDEPRPLDELRPDLPPALCRLVMRMLHKDPAQRPQTGREILRELNAVGKAPADPNPWADLEATAPPPPPAAPSAAHSVAAPPGLTHWWKYLVAVALAIMTGAIARFAIAPPRSGPPTPMPGPGISEDERFLYDSVARYGDAPLTAARAQRAFRDHVQLLNLYLEQRRDADAQQLLHQMTSKDPGLQFAKDLYQGILYARDGEPEKAIKTWEFAFAAPNHRSYLAALMTPPSREAVDLRDYLVDAMLRVERTHKLPAELARAKAEALNFLNRPLGPGLKKG